MSFNFCAAQLICVLSVGTRSKYGNICNFITKNILQCQFYIQFYNIFPFNTIVFTVNVFIYSYLVIYQTHVLRLQVLNIKIFFMVSF